MRIIPNKKIPNWLYAIGTLSGTIIGVGLFSLPYITAQVGIWVMLGYFLVLGIVAILIHLFYGEIALKTPDFKRLPGICKIHLGNWAEKLAFISMIFGFLGSILAYLIVGGEFLESLLSPVFGGSNIVYTLFYFSLGTILIFFGIKAISKIEFWGLVLFFIILLAIFIKGLPILEIENVFIGKVENINEFFLPYGAVLFSLWGVVLVPEVEELLRKDKRLLKKIIPISVLIPILVYFFFILMILGFTGSQTTESALTGLQNFLGNGIKSLGLFLGLVATFTSFIILGLTFKKVLWYDLKIGKNLSWAIACFLPLFLFLAGIKSFISVISVVGGVMLGIDGILIVLMYQKIVLSKKKKVKTNIIWLLTFSLLLIFLLGIFYEIIYFIN